MHQFKPLHRLTVEVSRVAGGYKLMLRSPSGLLTPIGPRLQREQPLPVIQTEYTDLQDALSAGSRLQDYLDAAAKLRK